MMMKRPIGISILSIIHFLIGSLFVLSALETMALYIIRKVSMISSIHGLSKIIKLIPITGDYPYFLVIILYGIFSFTLFYTGYGLWKGWKWVWYFEFGLNFIVLLNVLFIALIIDIRFIFISIVNLIIFYYLMRNETTLYFKPEKESYFSY